MLRPTTFFLLSFSLCLSFSLFVPHSCLNFHDFVKHSCRFFVQCRQILGIPHSVPKIKKKNSVHEQKENSVNPISGWPVDSCYFFFGGGGVSFGGRHPLAAGRNDVIVMTPLEWRNYNDVIKSDVTKRRPPGGLAFFGPPTWWWPPKLGKRSRKTR